MARLYFIRPEGRTVAMVAKPHAFGARVSRALMLIPVAFGFAPAMTVGPGVLREDTGRIEGIATIAPVLTTVHRRLRLYDEPGTPPPRPAADSDPLANVVIYLDRSPALRKAAAPAPATTVPALHQRDETFVPHVLAVPVGTTVEFPNDDPLFHDVFSLSSTRSFDLARYPQGSTRAVQFNRDGIVEVFCHIHADMSAYILVLDNPFYATPDPHGHFVLAGIPPGDYRMVAWYERSHPVVTHVHVAAGQTAHYDVRIPVPVTQ